MTAKPFEPVPFQAHVDLLRLFLTHREEIVENIEALLNAQRKPAQYPRGTSLLSRQFEDIFFALAAVTASQTRLKGQLEEAHAAGGFRPRQVQHVYNDLIHPAEMTIRGVHCWQQTRWPGFSGRMRYAHTLFNLYVIRCLQFLSMRVFDETQGGDENPGSAARESARHLSWSQLTEIQGVLDKLWKSSPAGQPVIVRDARWLIPLAQSLITDELAPYFEVARQVSETLPEADGVEIQKAHARMLGGHLTSQIRYYSTKDGVSIDQPGVVVRTRTSNALDLALLVQNLVGLLKAYDHALRSGDERRRLDLAGAIYQGISPDPELFLNRVDMLSAYSMIEHVFIATDHAGHVAYSPLGQRHVRLLKEYGALLDRLIQALRDDFPRFRPVDGGCSPYGVLFGLPSNLIEHMALKALQSDAETRFSLEDVFDDAGGDADTSAAKLAWVNGWRKLPHVDPEVQQLYDYPQRFAEDIYNRIEQELRRRASNAEASGASRTGRLYIVSGDGPETNSKASAIPEVPARYFGSSESRIVAAHQAEPYDRAQLLRERQEGHFLISYEVGQETPSGWMALKKSLLAEVLGAGRDARISGLPLDAAQVLQLMCAALAIPENEPPADRHIYSRPLKRIPHRGQENKNMKPKNTICLWFEKDALEAARFYAATFPDSKVTAVHKAPSDYPNGKEGDVLTVEFTVLGIPCLGLNGGPAFKHSEAFSFQIATDDQEETDRYWNAIVRNGGIESECGWCKDRWGLSWQITPRTLIEALAAGGGEAKRAFQAMMTMKKIGVAAIEEARRG